MVDVQQRSVYVIHGFNNSRAEAIGHLGLTVRNFPPSVELSASYPDQDLVSPQHLD